MGVVLKLSVFLVSSSRIISSTRISIPTVVYTIYPVGDRVGVLLGREDGTDEGSVEGTSVGAGVGTHPMVEWVGSSKTQCPWTETRMPATDSSRSTTATVITEEKLDFRSIVNN